MPELSTELGTFYAQQGPFTGSSTWGRREARRAGTWSPRGRRKRWRGWEGSYTGQFLRQALRDRDWRVKRSSQIPSSDTRCSLMPVTVFAPPDYRPNPPNVHFPRVGFTDLPDALSERGDGRLPVFVHLEKAVKAGHFERPFHPRLRIQQLDRAL